MNYRIRLIETPRRPASFARFLCCTLPLFAALAFLAESPAQAQMTRLADSSAVQAGTISGSLYVKDSGQPAANVLVSIREIGKSTTTDQNGRYHFENVTPGTYTLVASGQGFGRTRITDVVLRPGVDLTINRQVIAARSATQEPLELGDYVVSARKEGVVELDPYEVRDRRATPFSTANLDLTRTRDDVLPFNTFSAADIERSGAVNIAEFLRTRIVQNTAQTLSPQEMTVQFGARSSGGAGPQSLMQGLDLRGWGQQEVVVLVNGLRLPVRYTGDSLVSPTSVNYVGDFANIPLGSIERIEYLTSAGSAIYGANATGGVINIITKQNYSGGQITLNYSDYQKASAPNRAVDFSYSQPLGAGFQLQVSAGWNDASPMEASDVADVTIRRWRTLMLQRDPLRVTQFGVLGATPNISGFNIFGDSTSAFTSVPDGATSTPSLSTFAARRGVYNTDLAEGGQTFLASKHAPLGAYTEAKTYKVGLSKTWGPNWRALVEYVSTEDKGENRHFNYAYANITSVQAVAPTNPFGRQVAVRWDDPRFDVPGTGQTFERSNSQVNFNLNGKIGEWRAVLALNFSRDSDRNRYGYYVAPVGGLRAAINSGAYNPFIDLRVAAAAAPSFYQQANIYARNSGSDAKNVQGTLRASGPIWQLPAGAVQLTVGAEQNHANLYHNFQNSSAYNNVTGAPYTLQAGDLNSFNSGATENVYYTLYKATTRAVYAESTIPVLAERQHIPLVNKFELFGSGRLSTLDRTGLKSDNTTYEEKSKTTTLYAGGFRYEITRDVSVRASQSIGFVPPNLGSFRESAPTFTWPVVDRRRNNESVSLDPSMFAYGGNANLKPETTESTNVGLIFTPRWVRGLRISFDYIKNVRNDAITTLDPQEILDLETSDPTIGALVTRAAPTAGAPNGVGAITFVDAHTLNLFKVTNSSADISADYTVEEVRGGRLNFALSATKNISFKRQVTAATPAVEYLTNPTLSDGSQWAGNLQVNWEGRRWSFGWSARYLDSLRVNPADYVAQGAQTVRSAFDHDVFANYRFPKAPKGERWGWILSDTSISFGVKNVFDREPRFWAAAVDRGVVPYDSAMGRRFWVQIRRNL